MSIVQTIHLSSHPPPTCAILDWEIDAAGTALVAHPDRHGRGKAPITTLGLHGYIHPSPFTSTSTSTSTFTTSANYSNRDAEQFSIIILSSIQRQQYLLDSAIMPSLFRITWIQWIKCGSGHDRDGKSDGHMGHMGQMVHLFAIALKLLPLSLSANVLPPPSTNVTSSPSLSSRYLHLPEPSFAVLCISIPYPSPHPGTSHFPFNTLHCVPFQSFFSILQSKKLLPPSPYPSQWHRSLS